MLGLRPINVRKYMLRRSYFLFTIDAESAKKASVFFTSNIFIILWAGHSFFKVLPEIYSAYIGFKRKVWTTCKTLCKKNVESAFYMGNITLLLHIVSLYDICKFQ